MLKIVRDDISKRKADAIVNCASSNPTIGAGGESALFSKGGRWLKANGAAIYATRAVEPYALKKWRFTRAKDGRVFAIRLWDEAENPRSFTGLTGIRLT